MNLRNAVMNFSEEIIKWYQLNKRDLPWRDTKDPYKIWLSEIILQQTRVNQGLPYFKKFISSYPRINDLAKAKEQEVLKLWQGLGYYSRARNLHATAKYIVTKLDNKFPQSFSEILKLKGIGEYTASAIASFAYDKPYPVIDGNVYRLLARFYGVLTPIDSAEGKKEFKQLAAHILDKKRPALFNQAIMEFGALICKPSPDCNNCSLRLGCYAFAKKKTDGLPVKAKILKPKNRFFNYFVIRQDNTIYFKKRTEDDIWKNLYDFPVIETADFIEKNELFSIPKWKNFFGSTEVCVKSVSKEYRHKLTHQNIHSFFWEIEISKKAKLNIFKNKIRVEIDKIDKLPVPKLIENYLHNYLSE